MRFKDYLHENTKLIYEKVEILSDRSFIKKVSPIEYEFENSGEIYSFKASKVWYEGLLEFTELDFAPRRQGVRSIERADTEVTDKSLLFSQVITCIAEYIDVNNPDRIMFNSMDVGKTSLYCTFFLKFKKIAPMNKYYFIPDYHGTKGVSATFYFTKFDKDSQMFGNFDEKEFNEFRISLKTLRKK